MQAKKDDIDFFKKSIQQIDAIKNRIKFSVSAKDICDNLIVDPNYPASEEDMEKLEGYHISRILSSQPSIYSKFDLNLLSSENISYILVFQPELHDKLDIKKMDAIDIKNLLLNQPQLAELFKDRNIEEEINNILNK